MIAAAYFSSQPNVPRYLNKSFRELYKYHSSETTIFNTFRTANNTFDVRNTNEDWVKNIESVGYLRKCHYLWTHHCSISKNVANLTL